MRGRAWARFRRRRKGYRSHTGASDAFAVHAQTDHFGSETKLLGQFGAGLEFRVARHIGWTNDLSFGVIDGTKNNFGMFRSGLNLAF